MSLRMASTAAPSPPFLSPRPTQRPAAIAAASVTRTRSRAMLRSRSCGIRAGHGGLLATLRVWVHRSSHAGDARSPASATWLTMVGVEPQHAGRPNAAEPVTAGKRERPRRRGTWRCRCVRPAGADRPAAVFYRVVLDGDEPVTVDPSRRSSRPAAAVFPVVVPAGPRRRLARRHGRDLPARRRTGRRCGSATSTRTTTRCSWSQSSVPTRHAGPGRAGHGRGGSRGPSATARAPGSGTTAGPARTALVLAGAGPHDHRGRPDRAGRACEDARRRRCADSASALRCGRRGRPRCAPGRRRASAGRCRPASRRAPTAPATPPASCRRSPAVPPPSASSVRACS